MEGYDSSFDNIQELTNSQAPTFFINTDISVSNGMRDNENNCVKSYETFPQKSDHNVVWGSFRMINENCPNNVDRNSLPVHALFNNSTKRLTIVNKD